MKIIDLLDSKRIVCRGQASSKKRALEELGRLLTAGQPGLSQDSVFESLVGRERLGSTGLGKGIAIPHGRISGQEKAIGAFLQLEQGVDFDAIDGKPVDLMFALLVPEHFTDEHLAILAALAAMFEQDSFCEALRKSDQATQIIDLFGQQNGTSATGT
jgi:PTS system nitrogen regulatory IIA component